jgi:hypothetical protein
MIGVTQGLVWQWANKRLPIPADRAVDAAEAIEEIDPGRISAAYRELTKGGEDPRTPGLIVNQLENDIDAVRLALGAICLTISRTAPGAGEMLSEELGKVPEKFRGKQGLIHLLQQELAAEARRAEAQPAAGRAAAPARPSRKQSSDHRRR